MTRGPQESGDAGARACSPLGGPPLLLPLLLRLHARVGALRRASAHEAVLVRMLDVTVDLTVTSMVLPSVVLTRIISAAAFSPYVASAQSRAKRPSKMLPSKAQLVSRQKLRFCARVVSMRIASWSSALRSPWHDSAKSTIFSTRRQRSCMASPGPRLGPRAAQNGAS